MFKITEKEWIELKGKFQFPIQAVFCRKRRPATKGRVAMDELRNDIGQMQSKLEKKLQEAKKTSKELEQTVKERDTFQTENIRLKHRIDYLEVHTKELEKGSRQVSRYEIVIQNLYHLISL